MARTSGLNGSMPGTLNREPTASPFKCRSSGWLTPRGPLVYSRFALFWGGSSIGLEYRPVTPVVAGSSPVRLVPDHEQHAPAAFDAGAVLFWVLHGVQAGGSVPKEHKATSRTRWYRIGAAYLETTHDAQHSARMPVLSDSQKRRAALRARASSHSLRRPSASWFANHVALDEVWKPHVRPDVRPRRVRSSGRWPLAVRNLDRALLAR